MAKSETSTADTAGETKGTRVLKPRPVFVVIDGPPALMEQIKADLTARELTVTSTTRDSAEILTHVMGGGTVLQGMMK